VSDNLNTLRAQLAELERQVEVAKQAKASNWEDALDGLYNALNEYIDHETLPNGYLSGKHGVNVSTLHRLLVRKTWQHVA